METPFLSSIHYFIIDTFQRNSVEFISISLPLLLSLPLPLRVTQVLHQHRHWRGWPLIIPFPVPIVNPSKVQGATRDLRILSTAINKKLPAAGDGLDSKYGLRGGLYVC